MHRYASPAQFQRLSTTLQPFCIAAAILCGMMGLHLSLAASPADYQQGDAVRIMYVHVPAAWLGSAFYGVMALASASYLIWRHPLADILAREAAPIGAMFTLITLLTGMVWGKPMWGAYWVWDARLTSMLLLLLLYVGYLLMAGSGDYTERSRVVCAWLAILGAVDLPIIKFSVEWWSTLHQKASILRVGGPSIDQTMLLPLGAMIAAFTALAIYLLLIRMETALRLQKLRRLQRQAIARKNALVEEMR